MELTMDKNGNELFAVFKGELDAQTSPDVEAQIVPALDGVEKLVLDFAQLEYISSAGLRVLLTIMQIMIERQGVTVRNVSDEIMSVLDMTGFTGDLNFE